MNYSVSLLKQAKEDILDIYHFRLRSTESKELALRDVKGIEAVCQTLKEFPERGHFIPELHSLGVSNFRETHCGMYRIFYEIDGSDVFIHAVFDGRRDLDELLQRRLLR